MAIGLAFVDIVGDTSRTEQQIERDMNRVLAVVEDSIAPVEITAAVDDGTEADLTREINQDLRAVQAAMANLQVNATLSDETRGRLEQQLRETSRQLRASRAELQVRVDNRAVVEETTEAVVEAVEVAQAVAPPIEIETRVDTDPIRRAARDFSGIGAAASSALGPLTSLGSSVAALGGGVQVAASLSAALQAMAPAAAVAAPAALSVASAIGVVKLATSGVGDAVKAAFDPSNPKAYAEALKGLSPSARTFVESLRSLRPELAGLKAEVQNNFFAGIGESIKTLGGQSIPLLRRGLSDTSVSLNAMMQGAISAASELVSSGTLGKALASANAGLMNLSAAPGLVVRSLGQITAAAGPVFEKLTADAEGGLSKLSNRISAAFQSGALQQAITDAVAQVKLLFNVLGDIGHIVKTVFSIAQEGPAGFLETLSKVTGELRKISDSTQFRDFIIQLFQTVNLLSSTALPLLKQALGVLLPVFQALLPPVQQLINTLGPVLSQIIGALAPVLLSLAQAVGTVVVALSPMITLAAQLITAVLPVLTPLFQSLVAIFAAAAPTIQLLANLFASTFVPILTTLATTVLPPLMQIFTSLITSVLPIVNQLVIALTPAFKTLSDTFVTLAGALAPVLTEFGNLIGPILGQLMPIITPIIEAVGRLAGILANELALFIKSIVVPALNALAALLRGDFSSAFSNVKQLVSGVITFLIDLFIKLPGRIASLVFDLGVKLAEEGGKAFLKLHEAAVSKIQNDLVPFVKRLPETIKNAIGNLGELLLNQGKQILDGLISGVKSKLGDLKNLLSSVTNLIPEWKGPETVDRVLLKPAGRMIMEGLLGGIDDRIPALESKLAGITAMVGGTAPGIGPIGALAVASGSVRAAAGTLPVTGLGRTQAPQVQVFIGERELTDIVDVRVLAANRATAGQIMAGVRF